MGLEEAVALFERGQGYLAVVPRAAGGRSEADRGAHRRGPAARRRPATEPDAAVLSLLAPAPPALQALQVALDGREGHLAARRRRRWRRRAGGPRRRAASSTSPARRRRPAAAGRPAPRCGRGTGRSTRAPAPSSAAAAPPPAGGGRSGSGSAAGCRAGSQGGGRGARVTQMKPSSRNMSHSSGFTTDRSSSSDAPLGLVGAQRAARATHAGIARTARRRAWAARAGRAMTVASMPEGHHEDDHPEARHGAPALGASAARRPRPRAARRARAPRPRGCRRSR